MNGEGVPQNDAEAVKWYRKAAENGLAEAAIELSSRYHNGEGVPQNEHLAWHWDCMAAENGSAEAQYRLGWHYFYGEEAPDYYEAANWFRLAAKQGYTDSQSLLDTCYELCQSVPVDSDEEEVEWWRKGAEDGNAAAQFRLGLCYDDGIGVPWDAIVAYMWYHLSSAQGYFDAKENKEHIAERMTKEQIAEAQKMSREWLQKREKEE
jgi:TPR repeat protein